MVMRKEDTQEETWKTTSNEKATWVSVAFSQNLWFSLLRWSSARTEIKPGGDFLTASAKGWGWGKEKIDERSKTSFKGIQDRLWFWIPRQGFSGFQVLDSSLCQRNLDSGFQSLVGFRILWDVFHIPKPKIPDSTSPNFPDSGIRFPLHGAISSMTSSRCPAEREPCW